MIADAGLSPLHREEFPSERLIMNTLSPVFSYIDPVSGVILLQLMVGACIGGVAVFFGKITSSLRPLNPFSRRSPTDSQAEQSVPSVEE
jgi:hypothetical protein